MFNPTVKQQEKLIALGLTLLLILIVIPLLIIGKYAFPSQDDYSYAVQTGYTYGVNNGGIVNIITQIGTAYEEWQKWQGTYFANYFAYVVNTLFMEKYYFITPYITLLPMIICELYAGITICKKGFGASVSQALIAIIPIISLQILYTSCPSEAYYWMCGATLYTTAYAFSWLTIGLSVSLLFEKQSNHKTIRTKQLLLMLLAFIIGGSNYISGLLTLAILFSITAYSWYQKHDSRIFFSIQLATSICFMLVSIFSPGATRRQSTVGSPLSPLNAIILSFVESYEYIKYWTILPVVLLMIALIPIFLRIIRIKNYRYPLPVLFTILSFCYYTMQFTPCLYAIGIIGANRIINLYRHTLYILLAVNLFYWLGYLTRICKTSSPNLIFPWDKLRCGNILYIIIAGLIITPVLYYYGGNTITTISAIKSLRTGNAKNYYEQYEARKEILTDTSISDAALPSLKEVPYLLYFEDIKTDPSSWENYSLAQYYQKNSVRIAD